jgi:hypothetical protein
MDATTTSRAHEHHYRDIANELRLIVLKMKQAEAAEELRLLAIRYERLAGAEAAPYLPDSRLMDRS